ncbi:MAG: 6-carboxytetrahydropterin synthase [Planctomycetaceae bacterium]|nr:6-carboxytetrahydropterin synthase [Planctomycetaceae bacterium]
MHTLCRQVRFSITPFLPAQPDGFNTYASKPTGEGLSFYLALWVEVGGRPDQETGFIVNVSQIDAAVREQVVPLFAREIAAALDMRKTLKMVDFRRILHESAGILCDFLAQKHQKTLKKLRLELNPYRCISLDCDLQEHSQVKGKPMLTYTEKFEFSAMHKLWNEAFTAEKNAEVFGKCANPAGHGHNYILEVTVRIPPSDSSQPLSEQASWIADFQNIVKTRMLDFVDHKNLNADIPDFKVNPTVENIVKYAYLKLRGQFSGAQLASLTVWENDRTYCTYVDDV